MTPTAIYIGYDTKEPAAFHVLAHSILRHALGPVAIVPLTRQAVNDVYHRPRGATESTEFSLTRFLVPYLSGYTGLSIFLDCDMLMRAPVEALIAHVDPLCAVSVCQHEYTPREGTKFLGQAQSVYPRKNWSSLMIFNNARCRALTPEYVNTATGLELHRFAWTTDDQIGALPLEWNWLVGEYAPKPDAATWHYTLGGPWFAATATCDHAAEWYAERDRLLRCAG